jgi:hypothetical protein
MARKRWNFPSRYDIVRRRIEDILQGKRPGSDLVILDDEFSPTSQQLWEFAIIERVSGQVVINTCVEHPDGVDHDMWGAHSLLRRMSRTKAAQVFSPSRIRNTGRMNVDEIASKLQQAGITSRHGHPRIPQFDDRSEDIEAIPGHSGILWNLAARRELHTATAASPRESLSGAA